MSICRKCIFCTPFRPLLSGAAAPNATTGRRAVQPPNFWVIIETRRRSLGRSSHNWPPGSRSNVDHPRPCADARAAKSVQQPCSNPSISPEMLRNAPTQKYSYLQAFCKPRKGPAKFRAASARRRAGGRFPSAPTCSRGYAYSGLRARMKWVSRSGMGSTSIPSKPAALSHPVYSPSE